MKKILLILLLIFTTHLYSQDDSISVYLDGTSITNISSDKENIWVATNGKGIFKYSLKTEKWENYSSENGNLQHDIFYCVAANDKYVWAGSTDGLFILDKKRNTWTKRKFGLGGQLSNWIRSLAYDKYEDILWIGRFKYLTEFDLKKQRFTDHDLTIAGIEKTNTIKDIAVDGDSVVWFATEAGLHKYNKKKNIDDPDAIFFYDNRNNYFAGLGEQVSISSIAFESRNIWIGLDEFTTPERPDFNVGGIFKFNRKNDWTKFDVSNGLTGNGINSIAITGNYVWAGLYQFGRDTKEMYGRGLALINRTNNKVSIIRNNIISPNINCIYFDGTNIWIGTSSNVVKIKIVNNLAKW